MRRRLYLQIYGAFLGLAALCVATAAGLAALMWHGGPDVPPTARGVVVWALEGLPQPGAADFDPRFRELGERLSLDLTLWSPQGDVLGQAGRPQPPDLARCPYEGWFHRGETSGLLMRLDDGRCLAASARGGATPPLGRAPAGLVFPVLFACMAAGCYPVARRITWRLEALQRGVQRWGKGELGARVPVVGKDEVAQLAVTFNQAASEVQALMDAQRRVLANASHELRSPLARLRLALALLEEEDASGERRQTWDEASRDIDELDALIGDVLLAARLESGKAAPRHEPVDLRAILEDEAGRLGVPVQGPDARVHGDPALLRRLVRNLLENALRHGEPPVTAEIRAEGGQWRLIVEDRGSGVPPEDAARIFEPFYRRAGHSEGADGGVGLGLALARQIAVSHGGDVVYTPRAGGGSAFVVSLPAL